MTDEAAKELAAAMNRLAATLESLKAGSFGGIQVYHHGFPQPQPYYGGPYRPQTTGNGTYYQGFNT